MGKGEERVRVKSKDVTKKIVIVYNDNNEKEYIFKNNDEAMKTWNSLFTDLDDIKSLDYYTKVGDTFIKKIKYVTKTDTLKLL